MDPVYAQLSSVGLGVAGTNSLDLTLRKTAQVTVSLFTVDIFWQKGRRFRPPLTSDYVYYGKCHTPQCCARVSARYWGCFLDHPAFMVLDKLLRPV